MQKIHLSFLLLFSAAVLWAQMDNQKLSELIEKTRSTFDVPGISVGIIKDGKVVYAQGHGVASLKDQRPMNEKTLVGIASNSKGFTATALAMLVDEGKLSWDDRVQKHLPEFQMYDPYVSKNITVRDLITHRSGLGLGQGDLMFFPEGGTLSIKDIVHNVRYLKPQNDFRSTLDYNNILFIVAGEVISRISGKSWAEFIEERILRPVGMLSSYGSYNRALGVVNKIDAHAPVGGKAVAVPHDWNETANAAGGIMSSVEDMLVWADFLMKGFTTKDGKKLVSDRQIQQLWQIQQPSPVALQNPYDTKYYGYGLGWFVSDVKGVRQIQHSGGLIGTVTHFTLLPEKNLGIVVLTNQQSGAAFTALTNTIKDAYLGLEERDWVGTLSARTTQSTKRFEEQKKTAYEKAANFKKQKNQQIDPSNFLGTYKDPWFGEVVLSNENGRYRIFSKTSPRLKGTLLPYSPVAFIAQWDDRSYDADAYFILEMDQDGKATGAKMRAISDITDFSFDFQDLDLKKVP